MWNGGSSYESTVHAEPVGDFAATAASRPGGAGATSEARDLYSGAVVTVLVSGGPG